MIYFRFAKPSQSRETMFERYSETARRVIFSSRYMASRVGSPEIETEHLLLGLLRTDKALARRFLGSPWAAEAVWRKIEQSKPAREKTPGPRELPLSSASKHVLALAAEEADLLSNKHICTEHLLLGLLREEKCFATEILHACCINNMDSPNGSSIKVSTRGQLSQRYLWPNMLG